MQSRISKIPLWISFWIVYVAGFTLLDVSLRVLLHSIVDFTAANRIYVALWVLPLFKVIVTTIYLMVASVVVVLSSNNTKYQVAGMISRVFVIVFFVWWLARVYESYLVLRIIGVAWWWRELYQVRLTHLTRLSCIAKLAGPSLAPPFGDASHFTPKGSAHSGRSQQRYEVAPIFLIGRICESALIR